VTEKGTTIIEAYMPGNKKLRNLYKLRISKKLKNPVVGCENYGKSSHARAYHKLLKILNNCGPCKVYAPK